jgi:hypothetical protein
VVLERMLKAKAGPTPTRPGSDLDTAAIYAKIGNNDRAFDMLERAYAERNMWLMNLKVDPRWVALRSDPRYQNLLDGIGLT